jgi:hypothetical protein
MTTSNTMRFLSNTPVTSTQSAVVPPSSDQGGSGFWLNGGPSSTYGKLDLPVALLSDDQYAAISLKDQTNNWPSALYDNGDYPNRKITVWPVPTRACVLTLWLWQPLVSTLDLDAEIQLPPGYERALKFNLAIELAAEFGKTIPPQVQYIAQESLAKIRRLNAAANGNQVMKQANLHSFGHHNWSYITGGFTPFNY